MKTLLEALLAIRAGKRMPEHGICGNVLDHAGRHAESDNYELMKGWPEHSGDKAYPVPSHIVGLGPCKAYWETADKWVGPSGAARLRLLDWCITELESRDANHPER